MFKKIITAVAGIIAVVAAFILGRNSDRGRISGSDELADGIGKSVDESGKINSDIGAGIERAEELTDDIKGNNSSAIGNIKTAKNILERARKRTDAKKD